MKKGFLVVATALLAFAFSSCLNLGDNTDYVQDYVFMGTVTTGGVNPVFLLDEGFSVTPEASMPADTFVVGERYYLHFILGDTTNHAPKLYPIKFYRYGKTDIKSLIVLPKDSTDKWKNQPVSMANIWYSSHYCNFFFVSFAGIGTPNTFELIRMKENENTTPTDTVPKLVFELRHNVPGYSSAYSYLRFYSFDLSSLQTDFPNAYKFNISVKWNDYVYGTQSYAKYYIPN
jgi:hypothetical protein